jgi:L-lactate dehydrogenase complex protein LldE
VTMRASLLVTCLVDALFPEVGWSAVRVLRECGVEVDFPAGQTCCGQPAFNTGYRKEAARSARALIRAFSSSERIICLSGSCTAMIRHQYPRLLAGTLWESEAAALAARTFEFSEFLVDVLHSPGLTGRRVARAVVHDSCHTRRMLGIERQPRALLSALDGLEVVPLPRSVDCCGFGGTFSVKMEPISAAMVDEKVDHILEASADLVVGLDMSCLMNIDGRLRRRRAPVRVEHLAQVLAGRAAAGSS